MEFLAKSFEELTTIELYDILQLRSEVFVVEQKCIYQDIDGKDQKALHILGIKEGALVAYTRLFKPNYYFEEASIGRVLVVASERKYGYGHDLIKFSIQTVHNTFSTKEIKIGAQTYLKKFYESHGFKQVGEEYIEDGIPHIYMIR
ncbi:GNAT family N-acetyltransferase [Tenacibaculum amylolyticum]|uniref:GNAT family N-acetyltransferase n=1 Tax=Tenacibaculum amylolyticum TaxID=104269 RepID=UPI003894510F